MNNRADIKNGDPTISENFRYIHNTNLTKKNILEQKFNSSEIMKKVLTEENHEENAYKENYKNIKLSDEIIEICSTKKKEISDYNNIYEKKKEEDKINNDNISNSNEHSEVKKIKKKKNNIYYNYISKEKCKENIEKLNNKINELLQRVFKAYGESNKKQYFSRLFQMRDVNCIFSCMFFSLLIIFFIMTDYIGVLLSLLLLMISIQLKFSRSYMTLLNSIVGVIIISIVAIFSISNIENKNLSVQMLKNGDLSTNSNRKLLILELIICFIYASILFIYMFAVKSIKKYKMQHLWIYHNVVNFFNLFDVCMIFCFGVLAFFFIFSCYGKILFIIFSFILFSSSLFTYHLRNYTNVIIVIIQTILLITNSAIASASISEDVSSKLLDDDKILGLHSIYVFYLVFLILFLVLHLIYIYYVFFSNENIISKWFSERKVYYSNVHPYIKKEENKNNVYFKYDKYVLSLDDHNKILNVQKTDSREIDIDFKKYIYSDLHLYKHILLKTAIDIKYSSNIYDDHELLKKRKDYNRNLYLSEEKKKSKQEEKYNNRSQKNVQYSRDFIIDMNESLSDNSEICDNVSNTENKRNFKQENIYKGLQFLLKKISTVHDEKGKNKFKVNYLKNQVFYFTNCKNTNYCTSSIFYSKYTCIIQVLLDNYDELIFYLNKRKLFTDLLKSKHVENEHMNNQIIPYTHQKEKHIHKNLCLVESNKIAPFTQEVDTLEDINENFSLNKEESSLNMIKDIVISSEKNNSNNIKENYKSEFYKLSIANIDHDMYNQSKKLPFNFSNYRENINISNTFRKSCDSCSLYLLNSNLNNCNSLVSNYSNDYIKIPIYSSSKLSFDENANREENCFWYYYPGIIARVYKEWLKCKNLDYKKFNNDFYYIFSNSNNLNEFLKSNITDIEKEDEVKLFDIGQILSSNKNIIKKIKSSYSMKRPSFLSEDLHSNSLNGIISNFLTDNKNANFDSLCFLNSKTLQSFFEDSNIKQFLSSLCSNKKELVNGEKSSEKIKNLIFESSNDILQNNLDYNTKSKETLNMNYVNATKNENTENITEKEDGTKKESCKILNNEKDSNKTKEEKEDSYIKEKIKSNNIQNNKKDENNEQVNLNDLLNYAETLILQNKKNDANMKNSLNNSLSNLSHIVELDITNMNSFDEIFSNFIKNLQNEKDSINSDENENDFKEKINSLKNMDESYSSIKENADKVNHSNQLTNEEDTLNNQIKLSNNMKITAIDKNEEVLVKKGKDMQKETYIKSINNEESKESYKNSTNKSGKTDKEELIERCDYIKYEQNELSELCAKQKIKKEFVNEVNMINKKPEKSSEYSRKKISKLSNELSYDSLNKYINNDLQNEKNRIIKDLLIANNSSNSPGIDEDKRINILNSSRIHNINETNKKKDDNKSVKKIILEHSNNEKVNNLNKSQFLNNNFENFSSYYIDEIKSSISKYESILSNENNILNKENKKNKYCYIKKIEDNNYKKQEHENNFNLSNVSRINLNNKVGDDSTNNNFDIDNRSKKDEKINAQADKSKLYEDEIKENIFISNQNKINYNLISDSIVFSNRNLSNTKKLMDKEEESNVTRELSLEMIDNFKKILHEDSMKRIISKENMNLNEQKLNSKEEEKEDTRKKQKQNFNHEKEENKKYNCESRSSSMCSEKDISKNKISVEKYCIHSNEINCNSNNEFSRFNAGNNKMDNYDDDDYENDFGYNSEYIKLIEEKNKLPNNFSNDLMNTDFDPDSNEIVENLKKYFSLGSNKKELDNNNFNNNLLLESISKYLENNKAYDINVVNELIFDKNKKKDVDEISRLSINKCKEKKNEKEKNEKLNNKSYVDKIKENNIEYYDISDENKQLNYHDKNLNIHLSSNSYDEPIINFLNTYISENNNKLMKYAVLKTKYDDNLKLKSVKPTGVLNVSSDVSYNKNENNYYNKKEEEEEEEKKKKQENNVFLKRTLLKKKNDMRNSLRKSKDLEFPNSNSNSSNNEQLFNDKERIYSNYKEYEKKKEENKCNDEHEDLPRKEIQVSSNENEKSFDKLNNLEEYENKINEEDINCKEDNEKGNDQISYDNYHSINDFESINQNETCLKYFCELKNKLQGNKDDPEEKLIKKADLNLIIKNNDNSSCESLREKKNYINKKDNKFIGDMDLLDSAKQKKIFHTNKNIFNGIYGFQNVVSETSSSTDNNLTGLLIGNDIFYESFVYKSLGDIENLKRRIDQFKKEELNNKENKELDEKKESYVTEDVIMEDHSKFKKETNEEELKCSKNIGYNNFKENKEKIANHYNDSSNQKNSINNRSDDKINDKDYMSTDKMKQNNEKYEELNSEKENVKSMKKLSSSYSVNSSINTIDKIKNLCNSFPNKYMNSTYKKKEINIKKNKEKLKNENQIYREKNDIPSISLNEKSSKVNDEVNHLKNNVLNNEFCKNSKIENFSDKENNSNSDSCNKNNNIQHQMENKENFKISLNGEILNYAPNQKYAYSNHNSNSCVVSNFKKNASNSYKKEEKDTNDFNNSNISAENDNINTKILTYHQTEEAVIKSKEYMDDKNSKEDIKCNNLEKIVIYDTPIPSSNAKEYLIHKNIYNEKSSIDIRDISSNSFFVDNDLSFINKNSVDSEKSFSDKFMKGSNLSKLSNNLKTEELKDAYNNAYNNLYKQYQQKTESNMDSNKHSTKHSNKSKKKKIALQKEIMKKRIKSMSDTRITLTTTTIDNLEDSDYNGSNLNIKYYKTPADFLKQNRYNLSNEKKEKGEERKKKNRYYDENNQNFYNSDYIQHFNTILKTYSWVPDDLHKKNNYLFKKSNTYLNVVSTEDSVASDMSNFVKDALCLNSSSNKSSNNYESLKRKKKKWNSERNLHHFLKTQKRKHNKLMFRSADILKNPERETKESFIDLMKESNIFPSIKIKNKRTHSFLDYNKNSFIENRRAVKQNKQELQINNYEDYSNMYENILNSSVNTYVPKKSNSGNESENASNISISVKDMKNLIENGFDGYSQEYMEEKYYEVNEEVKNRSNRKFSMNNKNNNLKISNRSSNYQLNRDNNNNYFPFSNNNKFKKNNDKIIVNSSMTNFSKNSKKMNILSSTEQKDIVDKNKKKIGKINLKIMDNRDIDSNYELKNYLTNNLDQNNSSSIISFNEDKFLEKEKCNNNNNNIPKSNSVNINSNFSFESRYNENMLNKHKTKEGGEITTEHIMKKVIKNSAYNKKIKILNKKEYNEKKKVADDTKNTSTDKNNAHNTLRGILDDDKKKKIVDKLKKKFLVQNIGNVNEGKKSIKKKKSEEKTSDIDLKKKIDGKRISIDQKKLTEAIQNFKNYKKMNEINNKTNKLNIKKKYMEKLNKNVPIKFPFSLDNFCNVVNSDSEIDHNIFVNTSK